MSQQNVPKFFAFYPYEFLSDENVLAMSLEQVGAYLLLMIAQFINGSIPSDIPTLARMLKRTDAQMEALWSGIGPCFRPHPDQDGRLLQSRVEVERQAALEAMASGREKQRLYRERKKAESEAKKAELSARYGDVTSQISNVTKPSILISSITNKENLKAKREANALKWDELKRLYPPGRLDEEPAARAWVSREEEADAILAGLRAALTTDDWTRDGGKYIPSASRFISEGKYKDAVRTANKPTARRPPPFDPRSITG